MSRYTDVDALLKAVERYFTGALTASEREKILAGAPTIDIVFCKECRHRNERCGMGEHRWCEMLNMSTTPDDFCSYGEREGE